MFLAAAILVAILGVSFVTIPPAAAVPVYPELTIWVHRLQTIDLFDNISTAEIRYYVGIDLGTWDWRTFSTPPTSGINVDENVTFTVTSPFVPFAIVLCDGDSTLDDSGDLSSRVGGGPDDNDCPVTPLSAPDYAYQGTWDLPSETLGGDVTTPDLGFARSSGEDDGSTSTDENDAAVWFAVRDTYDRPVADAGPALTSFIGESIDLDAGGSRASAGSSLEQYSWDFTDNGSADSSAIVATTSFATKQTFTARLTVTDSLGVTDEETTSIAILNRPPAAAFAASPERPRAGQDLSFVDTSGDADGIVTSWNWDFGDGTNSTERNPRHAYANPGTYSVTLTITDDDGATQESVRQVEVAAPSFLENYGVWILLLVLLLLSVLFLLWRRRRGAGPATGEEPTERP